MRSTFESVNVVHIGLQGFCVLFRVLQSDCVADNIFISFSFARAFDDDNVFVQHVAGSIQELNELFYPSLIVELVPRVRALIANLDMHSTVEKRQLL